ncbi:MAG: amidohydrolase family protein [Planctomycetales bacterium]
MPEIIDRRSFLESCVAGACVAAVAAEGVSGGQAPPAEIIDCHVHLKHGDAARTEWSAEAIVDLLDQAGIHRAIVFAMSNGTVRSIEMAREAARRFPGRLIPFLYALPSYERPVLKDMEQALGEGGFRGIKIHAGECTLAEYVLDPVLRLAGSFPVPCLVDCAGNAATARRLAKEFPQTPFWFAHMGRYLATDAGLVEQFIKVAEEFENVSLDLSAVALVYKIEEAVSRLGARRLVWGTDGPYKNPDIVTYARAELNKIRTLNISPADKELILGGNVARMLRLGKQ